MIGLVTNQDRGVRVIAPSDMLQQTKHDRHKYALFHADEDHRNHGSQGHGEFPRP